MKNFSESPKFRSLHCLNFPGKLRHNPKKDQSFQRNSGICTGNNHKDFIEEQLHCVSKWQQKREFVGS